MADHFVNMDSIYLLDIANMPEGSEFVLGSLMKARLLQIARNLQSMDDRQGSEYGRGWNDHKASHLARSNLVKQTTAPVFPNLEEAMKGFKGEVTKLPPDAPKQEMKETLTVDDLDLGDF